ncbi:MAG TPA: hypothetical protein PLL32_01145, partial [Anaeromyxobacteraceae bacterium]|nr:hypothetical protein [Anaeromyxobacteraceae bacterium]
MPSRAEDTWTTAFLHPEGSAPDGPPPGARVAQASRLAALGTLSAGLSHEMNDPLAAALAAQGLALEEIRALRAAVASGAPCADLEPRVDGV